MIKFWMRAAAMDDKTFEAWAGQFGYTRRPDGDLTGESHAVFRERVVDSMSKIADAIGADS
jgi:hypothetical protein